MHNGIDLDVYFEIIIYPVVGIFAIEMICRLAKIPNWAKLLTQAIMCVGFGIAYLTMQVAHWLTAGVLLVLSIALFYQARLAKIDPQKALY
ncbi:MAG: hypothetical protein KGH87_07590 [Thaumarchaeota archaeon]|nr:hypothetical protein [Nitrososphaerota archaeon]MDE1839765.1 hypothetical protein [Nitrososphaerota archaeon]